MKKITIPIILFAAVTCAEAQLCPHGKPARSHECSQCAKDSDTIDRNADTRISPEGKINVATAAETTWTKSGLPCTEYVANKIANAGYKIDDLLDGLFAKQYGDNITARDLINMNSKIIDVKDNKDLDKIVRSGDKRTKGVVAAFVVTGQGSEIDISKDVENLRRGDIVQYWYTEDGQRRGHAAIVAEPANKDGRVTLRGSQKGKEGTFTTTLAKADFKYAVRPEK